MNIENIWCEFDRHGPPAGAQATKRDQEVMPADGERKVEHADGEQPPRPAAERRPAGCAKLARF